MRSLSQLLMSFALAGCSSSAVIRQVDENRVIVQAKNASQTQVRAEADRGCAFHGRSAVSVSQQCLDANCSTQQFLFACKGTGNPSGGRSSSWLGLSVDDITDHLHADPPGSSEVVISRVYADGPAKRAGLQVGDIIETFNGVPVTTARMLVNLKGEVQVGRPIPIDIRRGRSVRRFLVMPVE